MGLKNKIIIAIFLMFLGYSLPTYAAWQGPAEIVSGTWGSNSDQFGIEYEDTNDRFPTRFVVLLDGGLVIRDIVNGRRKIYSASGALLRMVQCTKSPAGEWNEECRMIGDYIQTFSDGNIWTGPEYLKQQGYSLYSPAGQLIRTSTARPLELGVEKSSREYPDGSVSTVIQYSDVIFSIKSPAGLEGIARDVSGHLYGTILIGAPEHYRVNRYSKCGKVIGSVDLPASNVVVEPDTVPAKPTRDYNVLADYGKPVIAPNGDVYTWKRTPDKYSILKWTWVDDPNVPSGPDAPSNLAVAPSINGLYLTWTASPQDPGCVTGCPISGPLGPVKNGQDGLNEAWNRRYKARKGNKNGTKRCEIPFESSLITSRR